MPLTHFVLILRLHTAIGQVLPPLLHLFQLCLEFVKQVSDASDFRVSLWNQLLHSSLLQKRLNHFCSNILLLFCDRLDRLHIAEHACLDCVDLAS